MTRPLLNRRTTAPLAALFAMSLFAACGERATAPAPQPQPEPSLLIQLSNDQPFESDVIVASLRINGGTPGTEPPLPLVWLVNDTTAAEIDQQGRLELYRPGTVTITARVGARSVSRVLTVRRLAVQAVGISRSVFRLVPGELSPIGVRVEGTGGRDLIGRTVTLSADDPTVAVVDSAGRLRGVRPGVTAVRATSEGVTGTARVEVLPAPETLHLTRVDGGRLPLFVSGDTVEWDGVKEYHEVWIEAGTLRFVAGAQPRYESELRYVEYDVKTVNGARRMQVRLVNREVDRGVVGYDITGALRLTSELVSPLSHTATLVTDGYAVRYRIGGTDDHLVLSYRREPN